MRPLLIRPQQRGEHRLYLANRQIPQRDTTQTRLEVIPDQLGVDLARGRAQSPAGLQPDVQQLPDRHQAQIRIDIRTEPVRAGLRRRCPGSEPATPQPTTTTIPASRQINREVPAPMPTLRQPWTAATPTPTNIRVHTPAPLYTPGLLITTPPA
jgi:hypothetical protein